MTSRWGVCNIKNHNVTLNSELSTYNIECLNYVIVHELSHFIHPNHSKDFWFLVGKYYPNYKEIRKYLRNKRGCTNYTLKYNFSKNYSRKTALLHHYGD